MCGAGKSLLRHAFLHLAWVGREVRNLPSHELPKQSARCAAERAPAPYARARSEGLEADGRIAFVAADEHSLAAVGCLGATPGKLAAWIELGRNYGQGRIYESRGLHPPDVCGRAPPDARQPFQA